VARPQDSNTNAGDTAPGVDDGKVRTHGPSVNSKPGGRGIVWLIVGVSLVILAIVFIARPDTSGDTDTAASPMRQEVATMNSAPATEPAP
jgi:hypothetical protein